MREISNKNCIEFYDFSVWCEYYEMNLKYSWLINFNVFFSYLNLTDFFF